MNTIPRFLLTTTLLSVASQAKFLQPLIDSNGKILTIPPLESSPSILSIVTSTPSCIVSLDPEVDPPLSLLQDSDDATSTLVCTGATATTADVTCLATCSVLSDVIVIDGITSADVEHGVLESRHARTLTALLRARLAVDGGAPRQTILLAVQGSEQQATADSLKGDVRALFEAAALEQQKPNADFNKYYQLQVESVSAENGEEILTRAQTLAKTLVGTRPEQPLQIALPRTVRIVTDKAVGTASGLDTADAAAAFVAVLNAHTTAQRAARVQWAAWKRRVQRGLLVDNFGAAATALRKRILTAWDRETLAAAGLPQVAAHRMELRQQLLQFVDTAITQVYSMQIDHLESVSMKRLQSELLKTVNSQASVESVMDTNAAALRKQALLFETVVEDLQVPILGLTKDKAVRELAPKLNTLLDDFPNSPLAQMKRSKQIKNVVSKKKKPGKRGIDWGLDLVAVLRPDGFGTLQGYCGYQLPGGHSVTFGVHNDADDPNVLAQFGGERPPLLRFQPKLRLDVEL